MKINKYILEIVTFVCGAVVMIFELVGSRILGPYFGTSIFVWTSLIGIILGSLSVGYYFGGKIADKNPNFKCLSFIIFLTIIFMGITFFIKDFLLINLQIIFSDIRVSSIIASFILFSPVSVLLGMVSPYVVKLKIESLDNSGSIVGNLYSISTAGSIIGTFISGFYLIPKFGTNKILIILLITLVIILLMLIMKKNTKIKLSIFIIIILSWFVIDKSNCLSFERNGFIDIDTAYNRIWIYDRVDQNTNKMVKTMGINNENHSSMFVDDDELVNEYTKYYHLAEHFNPNFRNTLMIGGAGYSFPKDFLIEYSDASIDVVEIDPKVTELAKKYFRLKDNARLNIYHEDARVYLNQTQKKYDVIFGDAFGSRYSLPYQLTTKEAIQKKYDILNDEGVVVLNIISAMEGEKGEFLRAEYATYKSIFPQVYLFPVIDSEDGNMVQNIILIALKSDKEPVFSSIDPKLNEYLKHIWKNNISTDIPVLTDDFAPVDYYINKVLKK
ncbi:MAG: fused MFS/spermidine synthase [Patescibacteria group bacterium]|nr:fused MFS/spermidine synthase [Patescibacteria group bacterium]MDD4304706.1 fused MFS/spermidine synthase [Patescibacteria group bacterium]MDD4695732.1 fused MFS/spermidine synthase [Patescibacteria group bacterium]